MDQIVPSVGIPSTMAVNPLLQRVRIPGETFTLPSGGVFYTNGELAPEVANGEVHVYPMTGIDELVMKSVDKILNGDAITEVFGRCIPQIHKPGALSAKDVDYLLVALKKVSYGPTFEINYKHDCDNAGMNTYELPLDMFLRSSRPINPTTVRVSFQFKLENGQEIHFKPATYEDVVKIYQTQQLEMADDSERSPSEVLNSLLSSVCVLIQDVDGITDRDQILEWLKTLPVSWLQSISDAAKGTTEWGIEFNVPIKCQDCGEDVVVPTPLNPISFFI